jgi:hypothetical protein
MIRSMLIKWLGIEELNHQIAAVAKHLDVKLEPQLKYAVKPKKKIGFKK